jgi:hypothetical protein
MKQSCPQGLTESDLEEVIGPDLSDFNHWMRGQTMSVCDGQRYHHNRVHTEECGKDSMPGTRWSEKAHAEGDPFTWRCGYDGGYYEPSECAGTPHGIVVYPSDVERYLCGYPVIDLCHANFTGT